jgi:hypothetical protein
MWNTIKIRSVILELIRADGLTKWF